MSARRQAAETRGLETVSALAPNVQPERNKLAVVSGAFDRSSSKAKLFRCFIVVNRQVPTVLLSREHLPRLANRPRNHDFSGKGFSSCHGRLHSVRFQNITALSAGSEGVQTEFLPLEQRWL